MDRRQVSFKFIEIFKDFPKKVLKRRYPVLLSHFTSKPSPQANPSILVHYLWYVHACNVVYLRVSKLLTKSVITSTQGTCPLEGAIIYPIGQWIDKNSFKKHHQAHYSIKHLTHIERLDPLKNRDLIIDGVDLLEKRYSELTL